MRELDDAGAAAGGLLRLRLWLLLLTIGVCRSRTRSNCRRVFWRMRAGAVLVDEQTMEIGDVHRTVEREGRLASKRAVVG